MRLRFGRRQLIGIGALTAAALIGAVCVGPIVRARVASEARRRHIEAKVGGVRVGWFAIRLLGFDVGPQGLASIHAHFDEVRVGLSAWLRVQQVELHGGEIVLVGSPGSLRDDWRKWRGDQPEPSHRTGRSPSLEVTGLSVRWVDSEAPSLGAELRGVGAIRDDGGTYVTVTEGSGRFERTEIDLCGASAQIDAKGLLVRAHAAAVTVGWTDSVDSGAPAAGTTVDDRAANALPPPVAIRTVRPGLRGHSTPPASSNAGAPLVSLPDLHSARAVAAAALSTLTDHVKEGVDVAVEALTWKIVQDRARVALTIGPGPLTLTRIPAQIELRYSTDKRAASMPLALVAVLPTDASDLVITLEGGPVSLSLLGVKEGAAGLVDVDHASVAGRARVVLDGVGSALTFDVDAGTSGLSLSHQKLAIEVIRGLDVTLRARGVIEASGEMRLDDFDATLGALHVAGSGMLDQKADHVAAAARFEITSATCQSLLESIPAALLPVIHGTKTTGTFGARGRFAFDTRSLDDLELSYDIRDLCHLVQVPPALDRDRFTQPFAYRIYLPDASSTEMTTGPGSSNWTPLDRISPYMQIAVLTTEDGAFPKHHGYNHAAIRASIIANLKARRFVRGASTITMQLAKNLFLSRDKTLSRKLEEVVLTDYLEQTFSKDEILELYLNVIEFGPAVYGIASAAEYYFGRSPAELDLAECLFLSSLLPSPLRYATMRDGEQPPEGWMRTLHMLMELARKRGLLTDAELSDGESQQVLFWHGGSRPAPRSVARMRRPVPGDDLEVPDPFQLGD